MQTELAPRYYLDNFAKLIEHAQQWYSDLLNPSEVDWITTFAQLSEETQCLLVRLYSRKGTFFRSDKLSYPEIGELTDPLQQLAKNGLIALNPSVSAYLIAEQCLTKPEVLSLYPDLDKTLRKAELIETLPTELLFDYQLVPFTLIELQSANLIDLLLTLFFANTHQDLSQFVLDDLGLHQFEQYPLSKERRFFQNRQQVEQLLALSRLSDSFYAADRKELLVLNQLAEQVPQKIEHEYIERKRQHIINDIARDYERLEAYDLALGLFETTDLPPSRERQARIYDKLEQLEIFSDTVTLMLTNPHDVSELEVAKKLEQRLKRRQGQRVPRVGKPKHNLIKLELDISHQRVELAVKEYFEQQGWTTFYSENTLLNGLFGLAFWEEIFAPVEGAFINAYQHRPLDLYQRQFNERRHLLIKQRIEKLEFEGFDSLLDIYKRKFGISNPFVQWKHLPLELVTTALDTFPQATLIGLFKVLLSDLKLYRNGMPDLIAFKDDQYHWVEVKGPGDKLQDNQLRWMREFERLSVNFSVCYVNH